MDHPSIHFLRDLYRVTAVIPLCGLLLLLTGLSANVAAQEPTPAQRRELRRIEGIVDDAAKLAEAGRYAPAGVKLTEAIEALDPITAAPTDGLVEASRGIYEKLKAVHGRLVLQEVEVPGIGGLAVLFSEDGNEPMEGGVAFDTEVASILVGKCGRCHVEAARGDFQMATYAELMRGTAAGRVVLAGNGDGSRIVQVIEEGDMPRGGGRVTDDELTILKKWIDEGARVSATMRDANLSVLAAEAGGMPVNAGPVPLRFAAGTETVSFALEIAPIIIENCTGCHLDAQNVSGGLNMQTFDGWLRGGDNGAMLVPGSPDQSLLIQKLNGTAGGDRMPRNRDPLADETIAKIAKWIEEGATYDGQAGGQDVKIVAAQAKASKASHDELKAERVELAESKWSLGLPNIEHETVETENFLVVGNVDKRLLEEVAERAEELAPGVVRFFKGNTREPFVKGRMTLYVFGGRYDYSEFGTMVEKRDLPAAWSSHWRYDVIDGYAAFLPPREGLGEFDGAIVQQLAAGYIASIGKNTPKWFADGAGYLAVAKLQRDDPRLKDWEAALPTVASSMEKPDDFITGQMPEDRAGLVAMAMASQMSKDTRRWQQLLQQLHRGEDFSQSFQAIWGATPSEVISASWGGGSGNSGSSGGRRNR